jgi:hypothetical protein
MWQAKPLGRTCQPDRRVPFLELECRRVGFETVHPTVSIADGQEPAGYCRRLARMVTLGTLPTVRVPPAARRGLVRALLQPVAVCRRQACAWRNREQSVLRRQGWAVPARPPVADGLTAHGPAVDDTTRILVTRALTWTEPAAAEADCLRGRGSAASRIGRRWPGFGVYAAPGRGWR